MSDWASNRVDSTVVKTDDGHRWVSTVALWPSGYETLVFECDSEGTVTDWIEVDGSRCSTLDAAREQHARHVAKLKGV